MNQNDQDRYFWRTGQQWSGHNRARSLRHTAKVSGRLLMLLLGAGVLTAIVLVVQR